MDLSIIIVNHNVTDDVTKCLESISEVLINFDYELILIDNNSVDKSIFAVASEYNKVTLIPFNENLGFGRANNVGALNAKGNYLLLLNPDTILIQDFITPIINFIENNEKTGACAPMLVYQDNAYQPSAGFRMGLLYEFLEAFMLIGAYRKIMQNRYLIQIHVKKPVKVGWVSGACFIIKKSVFEEAGGFTEDYFLNYEDIDLCRKLELAGYSNYYFPYLKCIHSDHKSFDRNYSLLVYSRYQSRLVYAKNHYNLFTSFFIRLFHITGIILRLVFVNILYSGIERKSRRYGYICSMKLLVFGIDSMHKVLKQKVNQ